MSFVIIISTENKTPEIEITKYRKKSQNKLHVSQYRQMTGILIGEKSEE